MKSLSALVVFSWFLGVVAGRLVSTVPNTPSIVWYLFSMSVVIIAYMVHTKNHEND